MKQKRYSRRGITNQSLFLKVTLLFVIVATAFFIGNIVYSILTNTSSVQYTSAAEASSTNNQVKNASFEDATLTPWDLHVNTQQAAATIEKDTTTSVEGSSSAHISVTQNGPEAYDVQLRQYPLSITQNDLVTLFFWAKADAARTIEVAIQKAASPYTVYDYKTFNLSTDWQVYSIVFKADVTDTNVWPAFNFSRTTGEVWIDKVRFISNPNVRNIYFGAYLGGWIMQPPDFEPFETDAQKKLSIIMQYQHWGGTDGTQNFQKTWMDSVRNHGSIPLITWEPWDYTKGVNQPTYSLKNIINGRFDPYIKKWALDSKAWGKPYFLRFAHEMNGNWYPWGEQVNGNQPGDYVKAWRRIRNIFSLNGVKNVTWVWSPNVSYPGSTPMNKVYPGSSYVDWIGLDGYNWGGSSWQSFDSVFRASYNEITAITTKPLMINETASDEIGGSKPQWINDAYVYELPYLYPKIRAITWFNINKERDWRIQSSPATQQSYADAVKNFIYTSNTYPTITKTPIPAP